MRRARVFISCGQRTNPEITIGKSVEAYFIERGFNTYFAGRVHSSDALTENIFRALRNSEYFVFIDFRREQIGAELYRGSLFVNQEIAIATFLGLTGVGFCENLIKREGILEYHIYNEHYFEEGTEIINKLKELTSDWDPTSVNELEIQPIVTTTKNILVVDHPPNTLGDWYHLVVKNNNKKRHAFNIHGYVTRILDSSSGKEIEIPTNELIWSGILDITVNIMGGTPRKLVAFYIIHGKPKIIFQQRPLSTSNPDYRIPDLPPGRYMLEYTIISSNFETVVKCFDLEFGGYPDSVFIKETS